MKTLFRITIIVFFTFLAVLLGEAYLRWHYFGLPTSDNHHPHPYLQAILRKDVSFLDGERLEEDGFRGTGPFRSGEGVYKILVAGDSCAFSISSSSQAKSFPALMEVELNRSFDTVFEVYNAGVPGYASLQILLRLGQVINQVSPQEVIIYGGWNDFRILMHDRGMLYIENNTLGMPRMYRHATYWELRDDGVNPFQRILKRFYLYNTLHFRVKAHLKKKEITEFRQNHPLSEMPSDPLLIDKVFTNFENNMENMITLSRGRGARVSLVTLGSPLRREYTPDQERIIRERFSWDFARLAPAEMAHYMLRFNEIIRDLARKYGCRLYDWEKWSHEADDAGLFVDLVHPSDQGYEHLVDRIMSRLSAAFDPSAVADPHPFPDPLARDQEGEPE